MKYDDNIYISIKNETKLSNTIGLAKSKHNNSEPYSYYIMLNNEIQIYTIHWTSAKITVDNEVTIEYADSKIFGQCPDELVNALKKQFPEKNIIVKNQDNVLTTWHDRDSGYLALYNILRDMDGLSQIGGWNNESDNVPALCYWIQKAALLGFRFHKTDVNFLEIHDLLEIDQSSSEKLYKFKPTFIGKIKA